MPRAWCSRFTPAAFELALHRVAGELPAPLQVVAIADIDTRKLTRLLREKGAQSGCIMTGDNIDETAAVRAAKKFPGLKGMDLAKAVSTKKIYQWNDGLIWNRRASRRGRRADCTSSPTTSA